MGLRYFGYHHCNKFGHTKICFSTVDHIADRSRTGHLALRRFSRALAHFRSSKNYLYPRKYPILHSHAPGPYTTLLLILPHVSDGRYTMCPNLLQFHYFYVAFPEKVNSRSVTVFVVIKYFFNASGVNSNGASMC